MLPPSWKGEVQKTVEETANANREQRKAEQNNAAAQIAASIKILSDAQETQTSHEDRNDKKNRAISVVTLGLVFLTVIFTGLSWCAFRDQLSEMQKVYPHIKESADAAKTASDAALKQAAAAEKQASAMQGQLDEMTRVYAPIHQQADAATSAANTARDALTKAQRAFVFQKDIFYGDTTKNGKRIWRGAFRWENSGLTPTKNADVEFVCAGLPGATSVADPYAMLKLPNIASAIFKTSQTFPPKDPRVAGQCEFFNDELVKSQAHEITLYEIAQITYTDIFDINHVTRFCQYIYSIEGKVAEFGNILVTGTPCIRYNCADEECKKEDAEPNLSDERLKSFRPSSQ